MMSKSAVTEKSNSTSTVALNPASSSGRRSSRFELIKSNESGNSIFSKTANRTEAFLHEVVDACASCVAVLDEAGEILYASRSWRQFEHGNDQSLNAHATIFDALLSESARATSLQDDVQCLVAGSRKEFHGTYAFSDLARQVVVRAARLNLPVSGFRILITFEDPLSSREALRRTEERFRVLLEKTHILPWEADFPTRRFISVGAQAVSILGYPIEDWYGPHFWEKHLHPDDRERAIRESADLTQSCDNYELEYRMIAKDRRNVWFHSLVTVIRENGQPKTVRGFSIDVTATREKEAELRDLSGRLIAAQEEERSRVARELHDGLNQRMALLSIELEQLTPEIEKPLAMRKRLNKLHEQVKEISTDIHRLSYKLHPAKLDHLGLAAALQSLCKELTDSGKLKVDLQRKGVRSHIPTDVTLCVFRIAQEALRNSSRHSAAQSAQVVLEQTPEAIRLTVSDNGAGFDPESDQFKKGLGFISMKERLRLVDGHLRIYSQPLRGTRIEVWVPLKPKDIRKDDQFIEREIGGTLSLT